MGYNAGYCLHLQGHEYHPSEQLYNISLEWLTNHKMEVVIEGLDSVEISEYELKRRYHLLEPKNLLVDDKLNVICIEELLHNIIFDANSKRAVLLNYGSRLASEYQLFSVFKSEIGLGRFHYIKIYYNHTNGKLTCIIDDDDFVVPDWCGLYTAKGWDTSAIGEFWHYAEDIALEKPLKPPKTEPDLFMMALGVGKHKQGKNNIFIRLLGKGKTQ